MYEIEDATVQKRTSFSGTISDGQSSFDVTIAAWANSDCRLQFEPVQVSRECYLAFHNQMGRPGGHSKQLTLSANSTARIKLFSSSVEITSAQYGEEGFVARLSR